MLSCGYQLVSIILWGTVICVVDHKQSELGTGCGSYAVVLLVSLLVSLMIAKFIGLRERCLF